MNVEFGVRNAECKAVAQRAKRQISLRFSNYRSVRYAACGMRFALDLTPWPLDL